MIAKTTIAIPDIHGRADLLEAIHRFIAEYASADKTEPEIIYLGDIVDRGPQSKECFDMVGRVLSEFENAKLVRGNHEDWFLSAVRYGSDPAIMKWLSKGGKQTLASYHDGSASKAMDYIDRHYKHHLDLIENAETHLIMGNVCFTHAGVNPERPMSDQDEYDLMWIREPFLEHVGPLEKIIVHGHTPIGDVPVVTENRISLDTDACVTGRLTVAVIDWQNQRVRFFQTDGDASSVVEVKPVELDRGFGLATNLMWEDKPSILAA